MKIIFWGKYIEFSQLETLRLLEKKLGETLMYVLVDYSNKNRVIKGWKLVNSSKNTIYKLDNKEFFKNSTKIIKENPESIHLFLSLCGVNVYTLIFFMHFC